MFLTRLNSTASAWKSAGRAQRLQRFGHAPRAQRHDIGRTTRVAPRTTSTGQPALLEHEAHALDARTPRRRPRPSAPAAGGIAVRRARSASARERRSRDRCPTAPAGPSGCGRRRASAGAARTDRAIRSRRSPATRQPDDGVELVGERHGRPRDRRRRRAAPATAAHPLRRRSAGSGSRSPSRPPRAGPPRARRCRPSCPAARGTRRPCRSSGRPSRARAAVAACVRRVRPPEDVAGNPSRELLDALGLVAVAAELLVEGSVCRRSSRDSSVTCRSASQKNFASRSRAVTTRSAFFAISALVGRPRVDDREERLLQLAGLVDDRKVMLMVDQRRRQHFLRQLEERRAGRSPATTPGNSTRSATSSTSALWSFSGTRPPSRRACSSSSRAMRSRRSACASTTKCSAAAPGTRRSCAP